MIFVQSALEIPASRDILSGVKPIVQNLPQQVAYAPGGSVGATIFVEFGAEARPIWLAEPIL